VVGKPVGFRSGAGGPNLFFIGGSPWKTRLIPPTEGEVVRSIIQPGGRPPFRYSGAVGSALQNRRGGWGSPGPLDFWFQRKGPVYGFIPRGSAAGFHNLWGWGGGQEERLSAAPERIFFSSGGLLEAFGDQGNPRVVAGWGRAVALAVSPQAVPANGPTGTAWREMGLFLGKPPGPGPEQAGCLFPFRPQLVHRRGMG